MTKRTTRVKRTSIVMPLDVYQKGTKLAEQDRRSFNNYMVLLVERAIADRITPPAPTPTKEGEVVG